MSLFFKRLSNVRKFTMTVLFVDDERQVLRGIGRMLDEAEVEWESEFADSGQKALETLANNQGIDTVVTDMRMAGMGGAELLEEISKEYPHIVRIVLSGQADRQTVYRAVNPMHQYLTKPCDAETLKVTIRRAGALRDALISGSLQRVIGGISSLPSLPAVFHELSEELESETSTIENVGKIIENDPAMTIKILQIANSAIFGLQNPVSSAARAATLLGGETIKALVLSVGVFQEFNQPDIPGFSIDALMGHGHFVAALSKKLAMHEGLGKDDLESAFTSGIVHDIGKLVLLQADSALFSESVAKAKSDRVDSWVSERAVFGSDHASVGAHLLSIWGLPQSIIEIVALHHTPSLAGEKKFSVLAAVAVANQLSKPDGQAAASNEAFLEYLEVIGCREKLDEWRALANESEAH
ncbi:MAG: putative nucleotidyltransferase with HDIG domain [Mariniblastus sp.]